MQTLTEPLTVHPAPKLPAWRALEAHWDRTCALHLRTLFADDPRRGERMTAEAAGIFLDYSKNRITDETLRLLFQLAEEARPAGAHRSHVPRGEDQRHGESGRAARGAAGAARRDHRGGR